MFPTKSTHLRQKSPLNILVEVDADVLSQIFVDRTDFYENATFTLQEDEKDSEKRTIQKHKAAVWFKNGQSWIDFFRKPNYESYAICNICHTRFRSLVRAEYHFRRFHNESFHILCHLCGCGYKDSARFSSHILTMHKFDIKSCLICPYPISLQIFPNLVELCKHFCSSDHQQHVKVLFQNKSNAEISKHSMQALGKMVPEQKQTFYRCLLCLLKYASHEELIGHSMSHFRSVTTAEGSFKIKCEHCRYIFSTYVDFRRHFEVNHKASLTKNVMDQIKEECPICLIRSLNKNAVEKFYCKSCTRAEEMHCRKHELNQFYICEKCGAVILE